MLNHVLNQFKEVLTELWVTYRVIFYHIESTFTKTKNDLL
jgi:hypothetical protein